MAGDAIIRVEGLGKRYLIGAAQGQERYTALRDVLAQGARNLWRGVAGKAGDQGGKPRVEAFWALRDVSFEVGHGEVLGVIGRNGAGKSTLLKILSRITEPSEGRITVGGRVASLLEVGTGFHPELTGRENVYLNGAILGMTHAEIRRKFDEIVDFAEVEKFLETPVKRYSSGMYVRLAFAVAAHLEPEILVVDEVLAVGDAAFQKKCIGKMSEVGRSGRTVLFVSHTIPTIERLCQRLLVLESGRVQGVYDDVRQGVAAYLRSEAEGARNSWTRRDGQFDTRWFRLDHAAIETCGPFADPGQPFSNAYPMTIRIRGEVLTFDRAFDIGIAVFSSDGQVLFWSFMNDIDREFRPAPPGHATEFRVDLPARLLNEDKYRVEVIAGLRGLAWLLEPGRAPGMEFEIKGGLSESAFWDHRRPGVMAPLLPWEVRAEVAQ